MGIDLNPKKRGLYGVGRDCPPPTPTKERHEMPVEITTLNRQQNFRLSAESAAEMAPLIAVLVSPSAAGPLTLEVLADDMDELADAITVLSGQMDDPDRIAAIRVDQIACCVQLDIAARPVDPRRLN